MNFNWCFFFVHSTGLSDGAIRSMNLLVEPMAVRRGQSATLRCLYDLEGAPLLSVKFYRGLHEFYRYSPTDSPKKKVFPFPGINVNVSWKLWKLCSSWKNENELVVKNNTGKHSRHWNV